MDNINMSSNGKNKKLFIILGLVIIVAIIVIAAVMTQKDAGNSLSGHLKNDNNTVKMSEDIPEDVQAYVPETTDIDVDGNPIVPEPLKEAVVAVAGANPITKEGLVVTPKGDMVKNDAPAMSPEAPKQTSPVNKEELPNSVIKLSVSAAGWEPSEFSVKAGAPVTIAITAADDYTHVFMFDDTSLSAVAVGVSPHETRAITFNSPSEAGEYAFHCDVPGHKNRGEVGKMIVK